MRAVVAGSRRVRELKVSDNSVSNLQRRNPAPVSEALHGCFQKLHGGPIPWAGWEARKEKGNSEPFQEGGRGKLAPVCGVMWTLLSGPQGGAQTRAASQVSQAVRPLQGQRVCPCPFAALRSEGEPWGPLFMLLTQLKIGLSLLSQKATLWGQGCPFPQPLALYKVRLFLRS